VNAPVYLYGFLRRTCSCRLRRYDDAMLKILSLLTLLLCSAYAIAAPAVGPALEPTVEQTAAQPASLSISAAHTLLNQGRDADAIGVLEQLVENTPTDFQAWFLLGVTQAKERRFHDAVASFGKVVALQPKLAEPHNNLAVIYNELGDFRAAVKELETSLKLKPDYATAHENIGDLYVKLAADAYRKALKEGGRPALRQRYNRLLHIRKVNQPGTETDTRPTPSSRLNTAQQPASEIAHRLPERTSKSQTAMVDAMTGQSPGPAPTDAKKIAVQPAMQQAQATSPTTLLNSEKHVAQQHIAQQNVAATKPQRQPVLQKIIAPKASPATSAYNPGKVATGHAPPPRAPKKTVAQADIKAAMVAVEAWRSAWNRQDLPAYFAAYSDAFDFSRRFETLERWKRYKRSVITKRTFIRVTLENIEATKLPGGEIRLAFLQHFRSDSFNSDDIKTMMLRQTRDGWKIIYEASK